MKYLLLILLLTGVTGVKAQEKHVHNWDTTAVVYLVSEQDTLKVIRGFVVWCKNASFINDTNPEHPYQRPRLDERRKPLSKYRYLVWDYKYMDASYEWNAQTPGDWIIDDRHPQQFKINK